jgi:hypothetical protein
MRGGPQRPFSKWLTLQACELPTQRTLIDTLYSREQDGYLIKGVLSESEARELAALSESLPANRRQPFEQREGYTLPRAFSQVQAKGVFNPEHMRAYLEDADWFGQTVGQQASFDVRERIFQILGALQPAAGIHAPEVGMDGYHGFFSYATFRRIYVNEGGMHVHCGSMFRGLYPEFYQQVDRMIEFDGQLSYFIMLQRPAKGGQLRLFDAEWSEYQQIDPDSNFTSLSGKTKHVRDFDFQDIDPMPGDMIVFVGGDIWHEVTSPLASPDRITLGGFLAWSKDRSSIYVWS